MSMNRILNDLLAKLDDYDKESLCILLNQAFKNGVDKQKQRRDNRKLKGKPNDHTDIHSRPR